MDAVMTDSSNTGSGTKQDILVNLGVFMATAAMAWFMKWQTTDVIWGLWISSLVIGYFWLLSSIFSPYYDPDEGFSLATIPATIFMLGFFTFHFGMFHLVHGIFLNNFFPIKEVDFGHRGPVVMLEIIPVALSKGWPLILGTFITRWKDFPFQKSQKASRHSLIGPYVNVIRMHILIFVFGGLKAANLDQYSLIPVLFFYFFPWSVLTRKKLGATQNQPSNP
jgi:hypothetical protein